MSPANLLRLGALGAIWGSSFILINYALEGLSPPQISLGRLVGGAVVLCAVLVLRRLSFPRDPVIWAHFALVGLIANVAPFWLFPFAQQRITSGLAGVLNGTTPLFTLLFAVAASRLGRLNERLTPLRVAGLLVGFAGILLVVAPWRPGALGGSLVGQLACLAAAACYGAGFVYTRRFVTPSGYPPLVLAAGQLTAAALIFGLAAPFVAAQPVHLTPRAVASVLGLGIVMTGIAYVFYFRLIAEAGPTSASMAIYLNPVVAVALGVIILDEPLTWNLFVGAAVVLSGVALAEGRLRFRPRTPADALAEPTRSGQGPGSGERG